MEKDFAQAKQEVQSAKENLQKAINSLQKSRDLGMELDSYVRQAQELSKKAAEILRDMELLEQYWKENKAKL